MNMFVNAGVLELVDGADSKSVVSNGVWVRVPPPAPITNLFELIKQIDTKINQKIHLVDFFVV